MPLVDVPFGVTIPSDSSTTLAAVPPLQTGSMLADSRFRILREIGTGGMGRVYEAYDAVRHATVALKTFLSRDGSNLYLLKNEFRSLAGVSHPNLVRLYELVVERDVTFLTMELVRGVHFDEWVRPGAGSSEHWSRDASTLLLQEQRLRSALDQLVAAVATIHAADKLHRDLKPANVLVTPTGRVVVLDFGLVAAPELGDAGQTLQNYGLCGTPVYISPEQAAGGLATAASDYYAIGVMLFQSLTGTLPFSGSACNVLVEKQQRDARTLLHTAGPPDLVALCNALLARNPESRPKLDSIRRAIGASTQVENEPAVARIRRGGLFGREAELTRLHAAFDATCSGQSVAVFVSGESGAGKTALCQVFTEELRDRALVLCGRCYEREQISFQGVDSLIDELSRYLRKLEPAEAASLLPREITALKRVFPVLGRVASVAGAPERHVIDLQELRQRAFSAFHELIARIRDRCPVVLYIDDAQWLDQDASNLLTSFFSHPDAASVLVVLSHRIEGARDNQCLLTLSELVSRHKRWQRRETLVGPLPLVAASHFASRLLGAELAGRANEVASEANGSPFFVRVLARYALRSGRQGRPTLQQAVLDQIDSLDTAARRLLEIVAVAGWDVPPALALEAADASHRDIDNLRDESLLRGSSDGSELSRIECYHDKIAEILVSALPEHAVRSLHARLFEALARSNTGDPFHLAVHAHGAGDFAAASAYSSEAARRAAQVLAFDRAAELYSRALEYGFDTASERRRTTVLLGDALANAGRGSEAARVYIAAAKDAEPNEALDLNRRAAEQLLLAGRTDEGKNLIARVLRPIGLRLPTSSNGALVWLAYERVRLRMRGLGLHEPGGNLGPHEQRELDILFSAVRGLSVIDVYSGAALSARYVRFALETGDRARAASALALEAWYKMAASGDDTPALHRETESLLVRAESLASSSNQPAVIAWTQMLRGMIAYFRGDQRACKTAVDSALTLLRERCTGLAFERATARHFSLAAGGDLGEFMSPTDMSALIADAWRRGDLYEAVMCTGFGIIGRLLQGDAEGAKRDVDTVHRLWQRPTDFTWLGWALLFAETWLDVHAGRVHECLKRLESEWHAVEAAGILRSPSGCDLHFYRGASALAVARTMARTSPRLVATARRSADTLLAGRKLAKPYGHALAAWLALENESQKKVVAIRHLQEALFGFEGAGVKVYAVVARKQLGDLLGGDAGAAFIAQAQAEASAMGVRDFNQMQRMLTFGLFE